MEPGQWQAPYSRNVFAIDEISPLLNKYMKKQLSITKFTELLNEKVTPIENEPLADRLAIALYIAGCLKVDIPIAEAKACIIDSLPHSQFSAPLITALQTENTALKQQVKELLEDLKAYNNIDD